MSGPGPRAARPARAAGRLLQALVERSLAPFDAVFDLLEQSGAAMHRQADALSESARALEQAAELMRVRRSCTSGPSAPSVRRPKSRRGSRASARAIGSRPAG